jgi:D-alanyl-D-alanine carboxypeptidase
MVVSFFCLNGVSKVDPDLAHRLQKRLDEIASFREVPGVTFCALLNDEMNISLASGYSDMENGIGMRPGSRMFSGSIGKTYAATVILQLLGEGKIGLEDPAIRYFEKEAWFKRVPNGDKVTIDMLLRHTTGIPRYAFHPSVWHEMKENPDKIWSGKDRLEKVFDMQPIHEPGKGWAYSDTNYIILGMIIEKVTGNDYYSEIKKRCLAPLGHKNTLPADRRNLEGLVTGYCRVKELLLPEKVGVDHIFPFNPQMEWTGGGVVSNVNDLAIWAKQLHSGLAFDQKTTELLHKAVPFKTDLKDAVSYGIATIIWQDDFGVSYGHTGFFPGYVSIMQYYPGPGLAVSMQINTDSLPEGTTIFRLLNSMVRLILEEETGTGK